MSYTALYRKYRPQNFENVVGQDIVVDVLKNSIINKKISHAYLFTGPRGTGKTSIAKIFAHAVNCENFKSDICNECNSCIYLSTNDSDIIEIDAASNNGVDEIRTLRENVKLMPAFCRYKIYIIDEVHMLSTGAFNALLKTLEEPPKHVIFILATTEPSKIPLTILSRCQRFDFKKISIEDLISRLKYIIGCEDRHISDEVLKKIAENSDGGLRDAINLLDQTLSLPDDLISESEIDKLSGNIPKDFINKLVDVIFTANYVEFLSVSEHISENSYNFTNIIDFILVFLRDYSINLTVSNYFEAEYKNYLSKYSFKIEELTRFTKILNDLSNELKKSNNQKMVFDIYMFELMNNIQVKKVINSSKPIDNIQNDASGIIDKETGDVVQTDKTLSTTEHIVRDDVSSKFFEEIQKVRINNVLAEADKNILMAINNKYDKINDYLSSQTYNIVASLLLSGKVVVASSKYLLFAFNSDSDLIKFNHKINQIETFVKELFDTSYKVIGLTKTDWEKCKNSYINNKKNNIRYVFINENDVKLEEVDNHAEFEGDALNIFGDDTVSVK